MLLNNKTKIDLSKYATKEDINNKVDKVSGKGLSTNDLTYERVANYNSAYQHSLVSHAPSNAEANVQSDWNETDTTSDSYIKNKPTDLVKLSDIAGYFTTEETNSEVILKFNSVEIARIPKTTEVTTTTNDLVLGMQYAEANEVKPNSPDGSTWKERPMMSLGSTIPTQSCVCDTCSNSNLYTGDLWKSVLQWSTVYRVENSVIVDNVGIELTDFKMWRYNETTKRWVLINEGFENGTFYLESFASDDNVDLSSNKILSSDRRTYKCLLDSSTIGRCFHPYSPRYNWSDLGFDNVNPCFMVAQVKTRLFKWDESGDDNIANANYCLNTGGDYWIYQGANFDSQFRHNNDWAIGRYTKITPEWRYTYATTCPEDWDKGFPVNTI